MFLLVFASITILECNKWFGFENFPLSVAMQENGFDVAFVVTVLFWHHDVSGSKTEDPGPEPEPFLDPCTGTVFFFFLLLNFPLYFFRVSCLLLLHTASTRSFPLTLLPSHCNGYRKLFSPSPFALYYFLLFIISANVALWLTLCT